MQWKPGQQANLTAAQQSALTEAIQPYVQAWVQKTGKPLNHVTRGQLTQDLYKQGLIPDNYNIDTQGQVVKDQSKTSMGLQIGLGVGGTIATAGLLNAVGPATAAATSTAAPAMAPAAAAGTTSSIGKMLLPSLIANGTQAGLGIYGMHAQQNANKDAMALQMKGQADQLAFLKEQAAEDRRQFDATQAQNLGIYQDERDYTRGLESQRRDRLAPYVQMGGRAMGQLRQPIRGRVGDLL